MEWTFNPATLNEYYAKWIKLGWNGTGKPYPGFVDPERLIVETTHVGRHEGRLLKAMLTWVRDYHDLINAQRLLHFIEGADLPVLGAVFEIAAHHVGNSQRLQTVIKHCRPYKTPQVLFREADEFGVYQKSRKEFAKKEYLKWGLYCTMIEFYEDAMFKRNHVLKNNPLLALRALIGPNIRSEIFFMLGKSARIHIKALAEKLGYAYSAVYNEVMSMVLNGFLTVEDYGRVKVISMNSSVLKTLLKLPIG
jgi:hypothetical protein